MAGLLHVLRDIALLVARIGFGAVLLLRGWRRWTNEGGIAAQVQYLEQFHTPQPMVMAWGGTLLEIVGGLFLIFGLLTPLVALAVLVQQIMVIAWTRWFRGPWQENGGYEYQVVQASLALLLVAFGGGRAAIDNLFRHHRDDDDADADVYSLDRSERVRRSDPDDLSADGATAVGSADETRKSATAKETTTTKSDGATAVDRDSAR